VEEHEPGRKFFCNDLWNWVFDRICWKKKARSKTADFTLA